MAKDPALGLAQASGSEPGLVPVKALASEKDPALGTDQGWGLAQASGLVPGLAPVKARVTERDPASVWELASEPEPGWVPELGQVKALASEKDPGSVWELASGPEPELGLDLVLALALGWVPGVAQA